ncbi:MAG: EAL domain-containing protein [Gammaproteobacteria bacterium]|nr:EAL domain-containing protein [Gammaproteobacteria bacterium]MCH9743312.1 EAL domain-containing protein [Gammaproteobacteria bacterium]
MKILIIDDSKTSLLMIEAHIKNLGHTTITTQKASEGITLFSEKNPDLVILDVVMEEMSGHECARAMRELEQGKGWVPIIFLSGRVTDEDIAAGINAGGDDYICKPFSELALKTKITAMQRIADMRHELVSINNKLETLSSTDALTGIANRFEFERVLNITLNHVQANDCSFALLFIDLDNFKMVNDTLGHQTGDELLKLVSTKMQLNLKQQDFIARIGGDEFAIILYDIADTHIAGTIADRIVKTIRDITHINDNEIYIGTSIGIACYPFAGDNKESLIKHADIAMYQAKAYGKNNYQYFTKELNEKHQLKSEMENALYQAIDNDELKVFYQPKLDLISRKVVGVEALLRWTHNDKNIPPDIFIPIAEETGIIIAIGEWVIDDACRTFSAWFNTGYNDIKLAINISPVQLIKSNIVNCISDVLKDCKLPTSCIDLEITETAIMAYSDISEDVLFKLHEMGITLSIDDFGTGYSSFSHIKKLPVDALKIDKEFVIDIPKEKNNEAIVKSIISMCKNLGLNTVAEGIETETQLKFLVQNGCTEGQGFYFSKPLPPAEAFEFMKKNNG